MGVDATCCVAPGTAPVLPGEALTGSDPYSCLAVPSFLESSSPSSESSTSSSSTSECFTTELTNGASAFFEESSGGNATSGVLSSSNNYDSSSSTLNCCGLSSPLINIPLPILEEDPGISMYDMDDADAIVEDLSLDIKPSLSEVYPSDRCCQVDSSCSDDMFLSCLDKFLEGDASQAEVRESGLASMNDLFPDLSTPQDFPMLDDMSGWSAVDSLQGLNSSSFPNAEDVQAVSSSTTEGDEESASQMFAQWLQSNAHWISLSDLRRIKLKTSTIENVTSRLGGGKKGLMLFLKFVLMWVQNSQQNVVAEKGPAVVSSSALHSNLSPSSGFIGTTTMTMEGVSSRDTLGTSESPDVVLGAKSYVQMTTALRCADWTTSRAQGAHTTFMHSNISSPVSSATIANGGVCSPIRSTNFHQSNNAWLHHSSNAVHGVCPSSMSPSLHSQARCGNNHLAGTDVSNIMMSMQHQTCADATPAATTRAARKSRMERQRWSVRRNRKWAAARPQHGLAAAATSSGYAHSNLTSWSQTFGNGMQKVSCSSSRSSQQSSKGTSTTDYQQSKRQERNLKLLFHKELKQSDVGTLGRIVLPKKAAETCLPPLELRDGVNLVVEDMNSIRVWNMRYRFWPNNKSRMYLLENTSDFIKLYDLNEGDYMMMYLDSLSSRHVIRAVKGSRTQSRASAGRSNSGMYVGDEKRKRLSTGEGNLASMVEDATNSEDSGEDSLLVELIEQSLEDLKDC